MMYPIASFLGVSPIGFSVKNSGNDIGLAAYCSQSPCTYCSEAATETIAHPASWSPSAVAFGNLALGPSTLNKSALRPVKLLLRLGTVWKLCEVNSLLTRFPELPVIHIAHATHTSAHTSAHVHIRFYIPDMAAHIKTYIHSLYRSLCKSTLPYAVGKILR